MVESEREALRGPMEETIEYLKTENRIAHLRNKKYQLMKYVKLFALILPNRKTGVAKIRFMIMTVEKPYFVHIGSAYSTEDNRKKYCRVLQ